MIELMAGMPDPSRVPQQQMAFLPPPRDMTIDVMGIRVPAEMLDSGAFWLFMAVCVVTVLGVAWLKYAKGK